MPLRNTLFTKILFSNSLKTSTKFNQFDLLWISQSIRPILLSNFFGKNIYMMNKFSTSDAFFAFCTFPFLCVRRVVQPERLMRNITLTEDGLYFWYLIQWIHFSRAEYRHGGKRIMTSVGRTARNVENKLTDRTESRLLSKPKWTVLSSRRMH